MTKKQADFSIWKYVEEYQYADAKATNENFNDIMPALLETVEEEFEELDLLLQQTSS